MGYLKTRLGIFIAIFSFALYAQSISFNYTLDDATVLSKNNLVRKGVSAIPTLLITDRLLGYTDEGARLPEYRPIPMMIFALQWQFFPNNPHIYHLVNVLLYSLTCWLLFLLLYRLLNPSKGEAWPMRNSSFRAEGGLFFPFVCALLFTVHPIHTEVVDNIKSLDEILCLLFSIISIFLFIRGFNGNQHAVLNINHLSGTIFFFLSLLSKESGITFLVIIPLILFLFTKHRAKNILLSSLELTIATGLYLFIRFKVLESLPLNLNSNFNAPLNNIVAAAPDFISQKATAMYVLIKYLLLLIFPYQLSYDYSFSAFPEQHLLSPGALIGILIYAGIGIYALINIFKKDILAFGILFYLVTLSPISNLLFLVGVGERFLYIPSLGFCIGLTFLLMKLTKPEAVAHVSRFKSQISTIKFIPIWIILIFYSIRTIARNPDWKNNLTLCSHDVNIVPNSAVANYNYGYELMLTLPLEKNKEKSIDILRKEAAGFSKAVSIYPDFARAYPYLASAYFNLGDYSNAIINYETALKLIPSLPSQYVYHDLGIAYTATGQYEKARSILDSALKYYSDYKDAYIMKSNAYLSEGKNMEAIHECDKLLKLDSTNVMAYINKGSGYANLKQYANAIENFNKGIELDSVNPEWVHFLAKAYLEMGDKVSGDKYTEKENELRIKQ